MSNLSANSHANLHYGEYDEQQDQSVGQQHGSGFDPLVFHQENHDGFQYHEVPFFPQTYHQEEVAASARPYIPAVSQMTLSGNFVSHPSSNYPTHNQGESLNTANPDDCFSRRGVNGEVAFNSLHQHGIFLVPLQFYGPQTLIDVNYPKASDFATTANSSRDYIGETFSVDPFLNIINICGPANYAVLKITNIPYDVTKQEVLHFLMRDPEIIRNQAQGCPIHVIMERSTSKTMDCYVEFRSIDAAKRAINRHEHQILSGRHPRIGNRQVYLEISEQNELLRDLFSKAKCVAWQNGVPSLVHNRDPFSSGFKALFTDEEMVGLVRHAENPQRSPFSLNCLQRTYECMISTLYKFPWFAPGMYTIRNRNSLFETYTTQLGILTRKVYAGQTKGLDHNLLFDFVYAGLNCHGFGERQKYTLLRYANLTEKDVKMSKFCRSWPFDIVGKKFGMDDENVEPFLRIVERGVQAVGDIGELGRYIEVINRSDNDNHAPLETFGLSDTQFRFNAQGRELKFGVAMGMELYLVKCLLEAGQESLRGELGISKQLQYTSAGSCADNSSVETGQERRYGLTDLAQCFQTLQVRQQIISSDTNIQGGHPTRFMQTDPAGEPHNQLGGEACISQTASSMTTPNWEHFRRRHRLSEFHPGLTYPTELFSLQPRKSSVIPIRAPNDDSDGADQRKFVLEDPTTSESQSEDITPTKTSLTPVKPTEGGDQSTSTYAKRRARVLIEDVIDEEDI